MKSPRRLLSHLVPLLCVVSAQAKPLPDEVVAQAATRIDQVLANDLKTAGLKANPIVDDSTFLRRAYLGIVGRIPSEAEARTFLAETSADRRSKLIDTLVASPGFDSHLFNWSADLLRVQTRQEQFGLGWHVWLRQSIAEDKPWNTLVSEMLGATGHCSTNPAVGYYLRDRNMQLDNFSNTMSVFLGRQIGCAQCHDHPFDTWSQYEYYQMAAFGGGIEYRSEDAQNTILKTSRFLAAPPLETTPTIAVGKNKQATNNALRKQRKARQQATKKLANQFRPLFKDFSKNATLQDPSSDLHLPEDYKYRDAKPGEIVAPETLFGEKITGVAAADRLTSFASWVTSPDNPFFTKVIANRLWSRTFGHGLVDPVDDWQDHSETAHPKVLTCLEDTMKGAKYDLRQFLRILYHTQLFQRECLVEEPVMGVSLAFRGPVLTRMSAEQLFDSFLVLTQAKVDDTTSPAFTRSWDAYRKQVAGLLHADPHDLLILAESAKQGEALLRKAQSEQRAAQKTLASATTVEARQTAQANLREARVRFLQARKQADPLSSMQDMQNMQGMQGMQPVKGGGKGKKGGKNKGDDNLRASEHPAPFKPGSLVREFGGSDRLTPSSSDSTATVPQALALLNDYKTDIATSKKSRLGKELADIDSADKRLDCLFINLFSQAPSAEEKQKYTTLAASPTALRDLARAMLTSNRFLFIQ